MFSPRAASGEKRDWAAARSGPSMSMRYSCGDPRCSRQVVWAESSRRCALAVFGPAAEAELAVDHGASEGTFGVVVGRLDPAVVGECPERGPDLQQRAGEASAVAERTLLLA
jgi:hypothetical protein